MKTKCKDVVRQGSGRTLNKSYEFSTPGEYKPRDNRQV